jgi:ParB/RepB/Spo0J family partition protein
MPATAMSTDTTADETIVTIPWSQLHDSPLQYRQTYNDATIAEIAASIRDTGRIHQPLVVRLRYPNPLFRDQYDAQDGFEIVFGHTRKRGGMAAGLAGAPCVVRALDDAQVRAAQAAENIARADVHPIEEAQGLRAMIQQDGISADELAEQLGKSRSYIYGRLKLLALCPEVRRAVLANEIGTEVGLLIARVGGYKMQAKALGYIKAKYYDLEDGGKKSFRHIRDLLNERFTLDLKSAIFDVGDEMLVPSAGYCGRCPKRSGNAPEFADVVADDGLRQYSRVHRGADICTDPDCFDAKKRAHLAREAAKLAQAGKTVITGNKARQAVTATGSLKGAYVELATVRKLITAQAAKAPEVVLVQDQRTGKTVQAVRRTDLLAIGAALPTEASRNTGPSPAEQARRAAEIKKRDDALAAENASRRAMLDQVRAATRATERSAFDLRLVATAALAGVQYGDHELLAELWGAKDKAELRHRLATMDAPDLTQLLLDCALVADVRVTSDYYIKDKPEALLLAAGHYGITPAPPTPSTAARAQKTSGAGAGAKSARAPKNGGAKTGQGKAKAIAGAAGEIQRDDAGGAGETPATAGAQLDAFEAAQA